MADTADVVIVGAGFAGLAAARVLRGAGLCAVVLERRDALDREGSGLALQPTGFAAVHRLGLLDQVLGLGRPFTIVEQCDATGHVAVQMDYATLRHPFAQMMTVRRSELIGVLGDGIPVHFGVKLRGLLRDGGGEVDGVTFDDPDGAHDVRARWVVGADGRNSQIRELAGIRSWGRTRSERYVVGLVDGPQVRDRARLYCGDGWADGVLPHPGRIYFFDYVNHENRDVVDARDFGGWSAIYAARIPDAGHVLTYVSSFDQLSVLAARQHVAMPRVRGRVALAGDAAASVHPHTGQGANFALGDGVALGEAIAAGSLDAVRGYGRHRDVLRARYVPYSVVAGRTLDATARPWALMRAASERVNRIGPLRRLALSQHAAVL